MTKCGGDVVKSPTGGFSAELSDSVKVGHGWSLTGAQAKSWGISGNQKKCQVLDPPKSVAAEIPLFPLQIRFGGFHMILY